jgi:plasmid maintenance system antidote protein VapI
MRTHNPPHPGEALRELCLKPLGLSVSDVTGTRNLIRVGL